MAEKKAAVNLPGLASSGVYGERFTESYERLTGHYEKRSALFESISIGHAMRECGFQGLLPLINNAQFATAPLAERRAMIMRYLDIISGGTGQLAADIADCEGLPVEPPVNVPPAEKVVKKQVVAPTAATIQNNDGLVIKTEPQAVIPRSGPKLMRGS